MAGPGLPAIRPGPPGRRPTWCRAATRSPAERTRSSGTTSVNGHSGCPANPPSTATYPSTKSRTTRCFTCRVRVGAIGRTAWARNRHLAWARVTVCAAHRHEQIEVGVPRPDPAPSRVTGTFGIVDRAGKYMALDLLLDMAESAYPERTVLGPRSDGLSFAKPSPIASGGASLLAKAGA